MAQNPMLVMEEAIRAHGATADQDITRLRSLGLSERGLLIESACEAVVAINRSRLEAGLPVAQPAPWPPSTWEFLRRCAASVRT